jgi:hypothetical protein
VGKCAQAAGSSFALAHLPSPRPAARAEQDRRQHGGGEQEAGRRLEGDAQALDQAAAPDVRGEDRDQHGQPQRATHLLAHLQQPRGRAGLLRGDVAQHGHGEGHERQTGADPGQHHRRQQVERVAAARVETAQPQVRGGHQGQPSQHQRTDSQPCHEPWREPRRGEDQQGQGQEGEPGPEGAVAEDSLHELHREEEERELGADEQRHHAHRAGACPVAEQPEVEDWGGGAALELDERAQQHGGQCEAADGSGRSPSVVRSVHEGKDQGR